MIVKGWYDPAQGYFVIDFFDEPVFELVPSDVGKPEKWAMFTHGICAVSYGSGPLRFRRIGIPEDRMEKPGEDGLAERLEKASRVLGYMGNDSRFFDPNALTLRQCRMASETITLHQDGLIEACLKSYRCAAELN